LTLNDGEIITLAAAIELLLERCEQEMKRGTRAPFVAWQVDAKEIQGRLCSGLRQMRGPAADGDVGSARIPGGSSPGPD
jgi:hypothetical protein